MRKKILAIVLTLATVLALCACTSSDYAKAQKLQEEGKWAEAIELYTSLDDYKDSKKQLKECKYEQAKEQFENGDIEKSIKVIIKNSKKEGSEQMVREAMKNMINNDILPIIENGIVQYNSSVDAYHASLPAGFKIGKGGEFDAYYPQKTDTWIVDLEAIGQQITTLKENFQDMFSGVKKGEFSQDVKDLYKSTVSLCKSGENVFKSGAITGHAIHSLIGEFGGQFTPVALTDKVTKFKNSLN